MKIFTMTMAGLAVLGMAGLAVANPALLPEHPGYPSRGEFTHDSGRANLTHAQSLLDAAVSEDAHTSQKLVDVFVPKPSEPQGAGQMPAMHGPTADKMTPSAGTAQKPKP